MWYLTQLARQGKRIVSGAGARLVPSSSSFGKLANLMGDRLLVYSGGFLSSSRTACVLLVILCCMSSVHPSDLALCSLTSHWARPVGADRRLEGRAERSQYLFLVASLRGAPSLVMPFSLSRDSLLISTLPFPGFRIHFPSLHLGLKEVRAPLTSCGITPTSLWFPHASSTPW